MAEHEVKFVFPLHKGEQIIKWLQKRCDRDETFPLGEISSIYYDTIEFHALREKINSDYLKTKYRLRWYRDSKSHKIFPNSFFEKKEKIGSSRRKNRILLPVNQARKTAKYLNHPYFMSLPAQDFIRPLHITKTIVPAFQITYTRYRFIDRHSGARLSVDFNIHVPRINPMMIRKTNTSFLPRGVFEYKSPSMDLPDWLHGVTTFSCRKDAFSKYSQCYTQLTGIEA